jgi:hypothetical protein
MPFGDALVCSRGGVSCSSGGSATRENESRGCFIVGHSYPRRRWRGGAGVIDPAFRGSMSAPFYDQPVSLEWEQTIIDARDPGALGNWWREALGWIVVNDDPDEFEIRPTPDRLPGLLFVPVPERKTIKNRLHLDFRPDDRDAEVERLLALGATRADIGQDEQSWVVLADPEGNEFCVLGPRGL